MKITASMLSEFAALGLSPEQMAGVAAVVEKHEEEPVRSAGAERQRRYRERHSNVTRDAHGVTGDAGVTPDAPLKERSPTPPKENNPPAPSEAKASSGATRTPRDELAQVLDAERAAAVVAHRKAMRKPLTAHAAALLAKRLAACPSPAAAADRMVEKGWLSVEPEWMDDARQTGPPRQRSQNGMAAIALEKIQDLANDQSRQGDHDWFAPAAGPNAGTAEADCRPDQRRDHRGRKNGFAAGEGDRPGRTAGHGGPVVDLEVEPRPAGPQGH